MSHIGNYDNLILGDMNTNYETQTEMSSDILDPVIKFLFPLTGAWVSPVHVLSPASD